MLPFALQDNLRFGFSSELPVRLMSHTSLDQGCARELVALVVCSMNKIGRIRKSPLGKAENGLRAGRSRGR